MTKLGLICAGEKQTILDAIAFLERLPGLKVVYITQKENVNLYIIEEQEFYKLRGGMQ